jgi:integrase/recombinase XerD
MIIDDVRSKIKSKYRLLQEKETLITAESIRDAYLGIQLQLKGNKLKELLYYYQKIWEPKRLMAIEGILLAYCGIY